MGNRIEEDKQQCVSQRKSQVVTDSGSQTMARELQAAARWWIGQLVQRGSQQMLHIQAKNQPGGYDQVHTPVRQHGKVDENWGVS